MPPKKKAVARKKTGAKLGALHIVAPGRTPTHKKVKAPSGKSAFLWAEGQQESGGNYKAVNSSSGALGRWQVMPANLPEWLRESGLPDMTPEQYLNDPKAQDKLALTILGGDYDKYGARGAASVWYSGQPNWKATYGNPPVYVYVDDVIGLIQRYTGQIVTTGSLNISNTGGEAAYGFGAIPKPGKDDWSGHVVKAKTHAINVSNAAHNHSTNLNKLTLKRKGSP